jgi:hypothetical protein
VNHAEQAGFLSMLALDFKEAPDDALLGARRTLNSELRQRGYCTDQDNAAGGIVVGIFVAGAFILGLLVGLSMAAVWAVS